MRYVLSDLQLDDVRASLRRNAQLFERPHEYVAGVEDAVAALIAIAREPEATIEVPELDERTLHDTRMI